MGENTKFAWLVVIPDDESVEKGILSAKALLTVTTTADVLAVVSNGISRQNMARLNEIFDYIFLQNIKPSDLPRDMLLRSCLKMTSVKRAIVVVPGPGTLVSSQCDHLFDIEQDGILVEAKERKQWRMVLFTPNSWKAEKLRQKLGAGGELKDCWRLVEEVYPKHKKPAIALQLNTRTVEKLDQEQRFFYLDNVSESGNEWMLWEQYFGPPITRTEQGLPTKDWIAVVGMSCKFPGANNLDEYWEILDKGVCTSGPPPAHRLSLVDLDDSLKANFLKCPLDQFDASFFGMSPNEASLTDPQGRLLLEASWEALEHAGMNPDKLRYSNAGVFCGSWIQDYKDHLNMQSHASHEFVRKYLANGFGSTAAKLSFFYGLNGPNVSTESGCSSAMVALHLACASLRKRECPLALVGGVNVILHLTRQAKVLAEDGVSKTFDSSADGYSRAEGIAVLVLKRYSDALKDGDNVHAIIRSSAMNQEGLSKSFGSPTVESEYRAMRGALVAGGLDPSQVDYVEAHATGTAVGDPIEAAAILKAYTSPEPRVRPLWIGSGKTNIGHTEACSRLAGIIKVILALQHNKIPRHLHLTRINPEVNFSSIPGEISVEAQPWLSSPSRPRVAGVSSFGISGTDVHVIVQEPPLNVTIQTTEPRGKVVLPLSAKSPVALGQLVERYAAYLESSASSLQNICFTAATCRSHHSYRTAFLAEDMEEMRQKLVSSESMNLASVTSPRIVFTFPGLTGKMDLDPICQLYKNNQYFQQRMNECDEIFKERYPYNCSLVETLFCTSSNSLPAEYFMLWPTYQYCLAKTWKLWGIKPEMVVGHCLGELTAALISGVVTLQDVYKLLPACQLLIDAQAHSPAKMVALMAEVTLIEEYMNTFLETQYSKAWLDIACRNGKFQTVVTGPAEVVTSFATFCQDRKLRVIPVPTYFPVHSRAVDQLRAEAMQVIQDISLRPTKIPYLSSVTGQLVTQVQVGHIYQIFRESVNYTKSCRTLREMNVGSVVLEVGVEGALTKLTKDNLEVTSATTPNFHCLPSFKKEALLWNTLGRLYELGMDINWGNVYRSIGLLQHLEKVSNLPGYPFQRKSYWFERKQQQAATKVVSLDHYSEDHVHPLLGRLIDSPVGVMENVVIFQHDHFEQTLYQEATKYLRDHVVGEMVLFPGAAFLEMVLAAGEHVPNLDGGLSVENFKVHAPLFLQADQQIIKVQCVLEIQPDIKISIYSFLSASWKLHVTAVLKPLREYPAPEFKSLLKVTFTDNDIAAATHFYKQALCVGLQFGPTFHSLTAILTAGLENQVLSRVHCPLEQGTYVRHPVLLDAMIQTAIMHKCPDLNMLHVPVEIQKFIHLPYSDELKEMECQDEWRVVSDDDAIYLFDSHGKPRAVMMGTDLKPTTPDTIRQVAGYQPMETLRNDKTTPKMYLEIWETSSCEQPESGCQSVNWLLFEIIINSESQCLDVPTIKKYLHDQDNNLVHHAVINSELTGKCLQNWIQDQVLLVENLEGILLWYRGKGENTLASSKTAVEPLLLLTQYLLVAKHSSFPKLVLVTETSWNVTGSSIHQNSFQSQGWGFMRNALVEIPRLKVKCVDVDPEAEFETMLGQLALELRLDDKETEVAYRGGTRYVRRLKPDPDFKYAPEIEKAFPSTKEFCVSLPKSRLISDVRFVENVYPQESLGPNEVKVEIRCVSLNFKDVLIVLNPGEIFDDTAKAGLEMSGVVVQTGSEVTQWKAGDPVFACAWKHGALKSHLVMHELDLRRIPDHLSFAEAATLPAVFVTTWHCMLDVAKLKRGQRMLVHAASGGVGLAAIQLAKYLGVQVIGTAGSEKKREFLRRRCGLTHVFNSRTLDFQDEVLEATEGKGVDMVLNCLTGPGFKEASLRVTKDGGHFVEISKLNIWTEAEVKELRPQVKYSAVDASLLEDPVVRRIMGELSQLVEMRQLEPLHNVQFPASEIVSALSFLQKAQHIGKVILNMPISSLNGNESSTRLQPLFNDRSSYLITGGKGAIGFALCEWMLQQGARYVVLAGRSPASEKVLPKIEELNQKYEAQVICRELDISSFAECQALLQEELPKTLNFPPLRGVHHCAGVLADKALAAQDWSDFEMSFQAKVDGTWNLHKLTENCLLEHFVLHSSAALTFGNPGQSNYVSANAFLDAIAQERRSKGLPALAVNWGQWRAGLAEDLRSDIFHAFSVEQGVKMMDGIMRESRYLHTNVVAGVFDFNRIAIRAPHYKNTFLKQVLDSQRTDLESEEAEELTFLKLYKEAENTEEQKGVVKDFLVKQISHTLGIAPQDVDLHTGFSSMGMDSLMTIEFTNKIYAGVECVIGKQQGDLINLKEYDSLEQLTQFMVEFLLGKAISLDK